MDHDGKMACVMRCAEVITPESERLDSKRGAGGADLIGLSHCTGSLFSKDKNASTTADNHRYENGKTKAR